MSKLTIRKDGCDDRVLQTEIGETLLSVAEANGISEVYSACGGVMGCGGCAVKIIKGEAGTPCNKESDLLNDLDMDETIRLGCQVKISGDMVIKVGP